jgi:hypothetical protein
MLNRMSPSQSSLWNRLEAFTIGDPEASLGFAQRLARDSNWSLAFARRVIEEYKKFLFLAMEAGHPVTPSDEVDQAWHLHLVYTESYWNELCRDILPRPLTTARPRAASGKETSSTTGTPRRCGVTNGSLARRHRPTSGRPPPSDSGSLHTSAGSMSPRTTSSRSASRGSE